MRDTALEGRRQNQLLYCVLFASFVSGAASQPLGSFIPFLRETYGFSYDLSGVLLSCQSTGKLLLVDGVGFFACFLVMFFSRTPGPIILGLIGVGLLMATIYLTAFAFGSDCIRGNDLGCSVMIFTGSVGGIYRSC